MWDLAFIRTFIIHQLKCTSNLPPNVRLTFWGVTYLYIAKDSTTTRGKDILAGMDCSLFHVDVSKIDLAIIA
jgi:hypothetical protein